MAKNVCPLLVQKTLSNATGPLIKVGCEAFLKAPKPSPKSESCIFKQFIGIESIIGEHYAVPVLPNGPC